jgi:hypothetical protein
MLEERNRGTGMGREAYTQNLDGEENCGSIGTFNTPTTVSLRKRVG